MSQQTPSLTNQYTPRGRFISGDLHVKQTTDYENKPIAPDDQEYYFAVAIPKTAPGATELLTTYHAYASTIYEGNQQILAQINMGLAATAFSWKIEDGDVPKYKNGVLQPIPEYKQGCYILKFSTKYEFGACDAQGNEIDPSKIKRGDFTDVMFTLAPNGRVDGNAGLKVYPNAVRFLDLGDAISARVSATDAFSGRAAETSGAAHPAAAQTFQTQQAAQTQQQATGGGMPAGNVSSGNPAATGMPGAVQNAQAGGMTGQTGGMPAASQAQQTASPSDAGVQPHNQILQGPAGGGMPGT